MGIFFRFVELHTLLGHEKLLAKLVEWYIAT